MNDQITNLGIHAWFARETGTVTDSAVPAKDATSWEELPDLEDGIQINPNEETVEIYTPNPTILVLKELLTTKRKLEITVSGKSIGPRVVELLFGTQALDAGSLYANPYRAEAEGCQGWFQFVATNKKNAIVLAGVVWCRMQITGQTTMNSSDVFKPEYMVTVLQNELNILNL